MVVDKIVNTIEKTELNIINATLLTVEEAKKIPERLVEYEYWWWLQSPGDYPNCATIVDFDGSIHYTGSLVYGSYVCIRPALRINLKSSNLKIGDCFMFANKEFEIISENLAFCKSDIGFHRFDEIFNNYETSEIKKYIDNWFKSNIK